MILFLQFVYSKKDKTNKYDFDFDNQNKVKSNDIYFLLHREYTTV